MADQAKEVKFIIDGEVELSLSPETIMQVHREWEAAHPGQLARVAMTSDEFANRMMEKLKQSARRLPTGTA